MYFLKNEATSSRTDIQRLVWQFCNARGATASLEEFVWSLIASVDDPVEKELT